MTDDDDYDWARTSEKLKLKKDKIFLCDIQSYLKIKQEITKNLNRETLKVIHTDPTGTLKKFTSN